MTTPNDKSKSKPTTAAKAGGLRLVPPVAAEPVDLLPEAPPKAPRKRSNLASFFDAYADAIDRDIKALLDL